MRLISVKLSGKWRQLWNVKKPLQSTKTVSLPPTPQKQELSKISPKGFHSLLCLKNLRSTSLHKWKKKKSIIICCWEVGIPINPIRKGLSPASIKTSQLSWQLITGIRCMKMMTQVVQLSQSITLSSILAEGLKLWASVVVQGFYRMRRILITLSIQVQLGMINNSM